MRSTEELIAELRYKAEWDCNQVTADLWRESADRLAAQAAEIARLKAPWTEEECRVFNRALQVTDCAEAAANYVLAVRMKGGENG